MAAAALRGTVLFVVLAGLVLGAAVLVDIGFRTPELHCFWVDVGLREPATPMPSHLAELAEDMGLDTAVRSCP